MDFDFRRELTTEEGEIHETAADSYSEELCQRFAESPEGAALAARGIEPGHYLDMFLRYALRYVGVSPAEMDADDVRETLDVMAEKVTSRPEDFDLAIPELEAFCDFAGRAFAFEQAAVWKRALRGHAPEFRRTVRDPRRWGTAKSLMMEGLSRGYDLSTQEGLDRWVRTKQDEQLARIEAERGLAPAKMPSFADRLSRALGFAPAVSGPGVGEPAGPLVIGDPAGDDPDLAVPGPASSSKRNRKKEKSRRKQAKASRRQSRH